MDSITFYGNKKAKVDQIENRCNYIQMNPISQFCRKSIFSESEVWKVFKFQREAIKYCENVGHLMIFSHEIIGSSNGIRNFIVASPKFFWKTICQYPIEKRCSYEVITVNKPCKLYFDIEFSRKHNKNLDGIMITNIFLRIVNYYIKEEFGINCSMKNIINLDSCTEDKFSKHLIYDEAIIFENNEHAGNFVKHICVKIEHLIESKMDLPQLSLTYLDMKNLIAFDSKGTKSIFCDTGVYTKNRNFRLYQCTKYGKQTPLVIVKDENYKQISGIEENIFLSSLITNVNESCTKIKFGIIKSSLQKNIKSSESKVIQNPFCSSPYTEIDEFIQSKIGCGSIRSWKFFNETHTLVYEINNFRYCYNISREHKSNGIMYVVNIAAGIYYQKCHDPDCNGYKSNYFPLPMNTMPWKYFEDSE